MNFFRTTDTTIWKPGFRDSSSLARKLKELTIGSFRSESDAGEKLVVDYETDEKRPSRERDLQW